MNLYFIAILPPPELREKVRSLKCEMRDKYGASHALKAPAHLTLFMPFRREKKEEKLMTESLKGFSEKQSPFPIELNGFDHFSDRVIFIRIADHTPLIELRNALMPVVEKELSFSPAETGERFHPHLTIATRDLSPDAFSRAWPDFRERPFSDRFQASGISLLKHNGKYWDVFQNFAFKVQGK